MYGSKKLAKGFCPPLRCVMARCMIKIFWGAGVQLLPLPTPCFKMFLERSLNDPHHPTSSIFHCYPVPHPPPPSLKILIIHKDATAKSKINVHTLKYTENVRAQYPQVHSRSKAIGFHRDLSAAPSKFAIDV